MQQPKLVPSSTAAGFFQQLPVVPAQYTSLASSEAGSAADHDPLLRSVLRLYLPQPMPKAVDQHLHDFARTCLDPETLRLTLDAEANPPTLHNLSTFGVANRVNSLRTGEGWRGLKDIQTRNGGIALAYHAHSDAADARYNRRIHHFAMIHLWTASSSTVTCPAAMSDGAAQLLGKHLSASDGDQPGRAGVFAEAHLRLTSTNPAEAWTSGQWMTERSGGSDVSGTETLARRLGKEEVEADVEGSGGYNVDAVGMPLGPWSISGFKWFSSATDSDMVVLLAYTPKGLSTFYAPLRRTVKGPNGTKTVVMNGVTISRLKNKLGTKALPTAELEIKDMRGWLVGEEGKGIREIAAILNTTRLWTAGGSVGSWSRGLAVSRAFARVRKVKGALLKDSMLHCSWMADETVKYLAAGQVFFLGVALQGIVEQGEEAVRDTHAGNILPKTKDEAATLLRALTPMMKAHCSTSAVAGLREAMESLGGVGYCENNEDGGVLNIAKMWRDCSVNPIWEGTVTVMGEDFVRAIWGKKAGNTWDILNSFVQNLLRSSESFVPEAKAILQQWSHLVCATEGSELDGVASISRALMRQTYNVLGAALLAFNAFISRNEKDVTVVRSYAGLCFAAKCKDALLGQQTPLRVLQEIYLGPAETEEQFRARL